MMYLLANDAAMTWQDVVGLAIIGLVILGIAWMNR